MHFAGKTTLMPHGAIIAPNRTHPPFLWLNYLNLYRAKQEITTNFVKGKRNI